MTTQSVEEHALKLRHDAARVVDRHCNPNQKQASLALYDVLASCKALVERCERDPDAYAELRRLFAAQPKEGNRRYVEKSSDTYVFVCRFVFTETDRTNAIRYASALREAGKMQLASNDLAAWMRKNGGVNALYYRRPLETRLMRTKTLRLSTPLKYSRDEAFSVTLRWRDDNTFDVLS